MHQRFGLVKSFTSYINIIEAVNSDILSVDCAVELMCFEFRFEQFKYLYSGIFKMTFICFIYFIFCIYFNMAVLTNV